MNTINLLAVLIGEILGCLCSIPLLNLYLKYLELKENKNVSRETFGKERK
jgi:hypothetical protein